MTRVVPDEARRIIRQALIDGEMMPDGSVHPAVVEAFEELDALLARLETAEHALREILGLRVDTTPGVSDERAVSLARLEMREIARKALASGVGVPR